MVLVHRKGLTTKMPSNPSSSSIRGSICRSSKEQRKNETKGGAGRAGAVRQLLDTLSWEAGRPRAWGHTSRAFRDPPCGAGGA